MQVLIFFLGSNERFAIDVGVVKEIIPIGALHKVPGSAPAIIGCMHVRGTTVPVLNISATLFPDAPSECRKAIIIEREKAMSFGVWDMERILFVEEDMIQAVGCADGLVSGVFHEDDGSLIQLIRPENIIARALLSPIAA